MQQLRCCVAIVNARSFAEAGRRLGMTVSGVSTIVAQFGARRTGGRVRAGVSLAVCGDRSGIDGAVDSRAARRTLAEYPTAREISMFDQCKLCELIQFAAVDAGSPVIDV